ncbi:glycoprotein-N-acetylgalactosamine 3-beta-galactosyltransferase 1-like [Mytilus edulis]|uniref:glycoprotein-N-acetylgalactosamine 3-beta-galactosyltransferase 1-like n=1 Tax=Mytilus edulis TaxID=6550 RepID=UPI0039EE484E
MSSFVPLSERYVAVNKMEGHLLEKFLCGFFIGVILYFMIFNHALTFEQPLRQSDFDIIQRLADKLDTFEHNILDRIPIQNTLPDLDADLHFHHDKMTEEGIMLRESISISCYIITNNCMNGGIAVNKTWSKRCNHVRYLVNNGAKTCGLPVLYLKNKERRSQYQEAISKIYDTYGNESDWTLIATDDNYVIIENVRYLLNKTSSGIPVMFGYNKDFRVSLPQYKHDSSVMVLSKSAMTKYRNLNNKSVCRTKKTVNLYNLLCMKRIGISYNSECSKLFNIIPIELSHYASSSTIKLNDHFASFRCVSPRKILAFEFFVYHLRPYQLH